jgi:hypothetical protein
MTRSRRCNAGNALSVPAKGYQMLSGGFPRLKMRALNMDFDIGANPGVLMATLPMEFVVRSRFSGFNQPRWQPCPAHLGQLAVDTSIAHNQRRLIGKHAGPRRQDAGAILVHFARTNAGPPPFFINELDASCLKTPRTTRSRRPGPPDPLPCVPAPCLPTELAGKWNGWLAGLNPLSTA